MQRKHFIVTMLVAVLSLGAFCWTGVSKAYAETIPADACQETGYKPYVDNYGCAAEEHSFYLESEGYGDCTVDKYDMYCCDYCDTYYYLKRPAGEHQYSVTDSSEASCDYEGYKEYSCSVCGDWYPETIPALGHKYKTQTVKADASNRTEGYKFKKCSRCGDYYETDYWTYPYEVTLASDVLYHNGKARKPKVTVKDWNGNKIASKHYVVTYSNNNKIGKATVKVKFDSAKYKGSLKTNFYILPGKIQNVSASYKSTAKMKVKWKKMDGVSGYFVYYSTSSKVPQGEGRTCIKLVGKDKTSVVIPYMAEKTYYVKVAGYKTLEGDKVRGKMSDKAKVKIKSGASMKTMLSHLKSTTKNRKAILELTNNQVDIKKYDSTLSRIKAIYTWHAKNSSKFVHCLACNDNFNRCIANLISDKQYDFWIYIGCDRYRNNSGSVVMHKWSILFLQGVPYIFDPRMQGNIGQPSGFTYFGASYGSSTGKHYLFDGYYDVIYPSKYYYY